MAHSVRKSSDCIARACTNASPGVSPLEDRRSLGFTGWPTFPRRSENVPDWLSQGELLGRSLGIFRSEPAARKSLHLLHSRVTARCPTAVPARQGERTVNSVYRSISMQSRGSFFWLSDCVLLLLRSLPRSFRRGFARRVATEQTDSLRRIDGGPPGNETVNRQSRPYPTGRHTRFPSRHLPEPGSRLATAQLGKSGRHGPNAMPSCQPPLDTVASLVERATLRVRIRLCRLAVDDSSTATSSGWWIVRSRAAR